MTYSPPRSFWPEGCKPTSLVKLGEKRIGIRMTLASGERMTMPLGEATFTMLQWRKPH